MSQYETLAAIGGMLDRESGEPTVWTCRYCIRYARTEAEIEHHERCPAGRLVTANTRIAALEGALNLADEVARLTTWGITVSDCREGCEHPACLILRSIARYRKARAALAGEGK